MDTITIPTADYTQRADDEGRDYHAYRTILTAAEKWADRVDRSFQSINVDDPDEGPVTFAHIVGGAVRITTCTPDQDMDGLYPAAQLPFAIVTPVTFKVGDYIARRTPANRDQRMVYRVTDIRPDGGLGVVYMRTSAYNAAGAIGLIEPSDFHRYELTDAPTVTYTVTVRGDHTGDDLRDMLGNLGGAVTVAVAK